MNKKFTLVMIKDTEGRSKKPAEYSVVTVDCNKVAEIIVNKSANLMHNLLAYTGRQKAPLPNYKRVLKDYAEDINNTEKPDSVRNYAKERVEIAESELNQCREGIVKAGINKNIADKIINKDMYCIRISSDDSYSTYYGYFYRPLLTIIIFNEKENNINPGYIIGEINKLNKEVEKKRAEKARKKTEEYKRQHHRLNSYTFRQGVVPHTASYHKGDYASKRGTGLHSRVLSESLPEYKEFSNSKYKYIGWYSSPRTTDSSWKSSCKVKKQYLKHGCKEKKVKRLNKSESRSLKEEFFDPRTTDEIIEQILNNKAV